MKPLLLKSIKRLPNIQSYKYGIDNIIETSYTSINFDENIKSLIIKPSYNTNNRCINCGYKECTEKNNSYESDDSYIKSEDN